MLWHGKREPSRKGAGKEVAARPRPSNVTHLNGKMGRPWKHRSEREPSRVCCDTILIFFGTQVVFSLVKHIAPSVCRSQGMLSNGLKRLDIGEREEACMHSTRATYMTAQQGFVYGLV